MFTQRFFDLHELHHGSHTALLTDEDLVGARPAALDAIIVPAARPVKALRHVLEIAVQIGSPVIALCSKGAAAQQAVELADALGAAVLALDVDSELGNAMPTLTTDELLRRSGFESTSDLSLKRNFGLTLARCSGWQRTLFLDDDIQIDVPRQLPLVAALLDRYRVVGLANSGYEDNSVVCHAYRATRGRQDTFIGGGAMMVDSSRVSSFFPNVYNEDWFFLLGDGLPFSVARAGQMRQRIHDPFADPRRATSEEFGDTLAEGLFWMLDSGVGIDTASNGFWGDALFRRRQFIDGVIARTDGLNGADRIRPCLLAALGRSTDVSHRLCDDFVEAWRKDLISWRSFLGELPVGSHPEKVISEAGLSDRLHRSRAATQLLAATPSALGRLC
jgi:hypothetical protein